MAKTGVFYIVLVGPDRLDLLTPMITTASNARKEYDNIMRNMQPSYKRRVQIIQFVSV
jgi:hypothetical protein